VFTTPTKLLALLSVLLVCLLGLAGSPAAATDGATHDGATTTTTDGSTPAQTTSSSATPTVGISLQRVAPSDDRVQVTALADARDSATDYWVEFGVTSSYGRQSVHQGKSAGPQEEVVFSLVGLSRGTHHFRLVSAQDPAPPRYSGDYTVQVSGIPFRLLTHGVTAGGVKVEAVAGSRNVPTEYWVQYGPTTEYGMSTPRQVVAANDIPPGTERTLTFQLTGLQPGTNHLRLVAQSYPDNAPDHSQDFPFSAEQTSAQSSWPTCATATSTECIKSFTVDGAAAPSFRAQVFMGGGGLQMAAVTSPGGMQELLYPGSPLSASSTVRIVVNAGTYTPGVLVGQGRLTTATVEPGAGGTVITISGSPLGASFSHTSCRIGACGDDTLRADEDYAGRLVMSAFPSMGDAAYVAAAQGLWISSNAMSNSTPSYNAMTGAVQVSMAGPHLTKAGELNRGYFQTFVPSRVFTDLWRLDGPELLKETVVSDGTEQDVSPIWTAVAGGWLLTLEGFHYSSPTVTLTPSGSAPGANPSPSSPAPSANAAQPSAPVISVGQSVISAGTRVTVAHRGAPGETLSIWSKTQPATGYSHISSVTLDASGLATTSHAPRKNTRIMTRSAQGVSSAQPLIQVRSVASMNVRRISTRSYVFSGTVSPALSGRLVSVYRNGVLVAQGRTNGLGVYVISKTLAAGVFTFLVRTPNDTSNLGATSRSVRLLIA